MGKYDSVKTLLTALGLATVGACGGTQQLPGNPAPEPIMTGNPGTEPEEVHPEPMMTGNPVEAPDPAPIMSANPVAAPEPNDEAPSVEDEAGTDEIPTPLPERTGNTLPPPG